MIFTITTSTAQWSKKGSLCEFGKNSNKPPQIFLNHYKPQHLVLHMICANLNLRSLISRLKEMLRLDVQELRHGGNLLRSWHISWVYRCTLWPLVNTKKEEEERWEEGVWWDHFLFGSKRWGRQRKTGHLVYISCKLVSNRWLRFTTSVDKPSNLAENNTSKNCPQRIFCFNTDRHVETL